MEIYRVERQRSRGRTMVRYGQVHNDLATAKAHADRAANTNAKAMQYGRYVVHNLEGEEAYVVTTEPLSTPLWTTTIEKQ